MVTLTFLFLMLFSINPLSISSSPDRFTKSLPPSLLHNDSQLFFELVRPLPSDSLTPTCSLLLLQYSFGNTINAPPFSTPYSPPSDCPAPWSHVVLELRVDSEGDQYDRIAGLWLGGAEVLRTSTAEPTESGIYWEVRKDVTRYSSLLVRSDINVTVMLENIVNDVYTGVYDVNVTLFFYKDNLARAPSIATGEKFSRKLQSIGDKSEFISKKFDEIIAEETISEVNMFEKSKAVYDPPADLIIPISESDADHGYWFRVESEADSHSQGIQIPPNTRRAILELYVSFHGNDEFWYSNPPNSYISMNNLTTGRGNGAYREVYVTIDGELVGSEIPFPVIFTGGINPLFWEPVVGIGAFDLPTYDFDLTPFLGVLLDGKVHSFGVGVTNGISYWLIDANLHLWLDSSPPQATSVAFEIPSAKVKTKSKFQLLDGSFKIKAERKIRIVGWVNSSAGNYTTTFSQEFKFKNSIKFSGNATYKVVEQKIKTEKEVVVEDDQGKVIAHLKIKRKYPLKVVTSTQPSFDEVTHVQVTNVSRAFEEKYSNGDSESSIDNSQESEGWMQVKDHSVLLGWAKTQQNLSYTDDLGCYFRSVVASNGSLVQDNSTSCASSL